MDNARFMRTMTVLARAFRQEVDEFLLEAYSLGLGDLTDEEMEYAAKRAIGTCKFMPSPVELLEFIGREPQELHYRKASFGKCACGITLEFADSIEKGMCGKCWGGVCVLQDKRREKAVALIEGKEPPKQIERAPEGARFYR